MGVEAFGAVPVPHLFVIIVPLAVLALFLPLLYLCTHLKYYSSIGSICNEILSKTIGILKDNFYLISNNMWLY